MQILLVTLTAISSSKQSWCKMRILHNCVRQTLQGKLVRTAWGQNIFDAVLFFLDVLPNVISSLGKSMSQEDLAFLLLRLDYLDSHQPKFHDSMEF